MIAPIYIVGKISRFLKLRKAHRENDKAVMAAYGFKKDMTEAEIVGELLNVRGFDKSTVALYSKKTGTLANERPSP